MTVQPEVFRHEIRRIIREEMESILRTRSDSTQNIGNHVIFFLYLKKSSVMALLTFQYMTNWSSTNISASTTEGRKVHVADADHTSVKSKV
jgi:hypothetical protein